MEKQSTQFLRLAGRILETTFLISLLIALIGFVYYWNSAAIFSNAFFIAGAVLIVLGVFSVAGGFAQRASFTITYAESAGQADLAERGQRAAADITQRYGMLIFFIMTGLLLIGISVLIGNFLTLS